MKTIWKYTMSLHKGNEFDIPRGGKVIHVQLKGADVIDFWAEVDPQATKEKRKFTIRGTGHETEEEYIYCGTAASPGFPLVWHLYEIVDEDG